jgi:hypothetical protein
MEATTIQTSPNGTDLSATNQANVRTSATAEEKEISAQRAASAVDEPQPPLLPDSGKKKKKKKWQSIVSSAKKAMLSESTEPPKKNKRNNIREGKDETFRQRRAAELRASQDNESTHDVENSAPGAIPMPGTGTARRTHNELSTREEEMIEAVLIQETPILMATPEKKGTEALWQQICEKKKGSISFLCCGNTCDGSVIGSPFIQEKDNTGSCLQSMPITV